MNKSGADSAKGSYNTSLFRVKVLSVICAVALLSLIFSFSVLADYIQPDAVVSEMLEPVPSYSFDSGVYSYFFSWITFRPGNTTNDGYLRHDITVSASQPIDRFIASNVLVSSGQFSFHVSRYHLDGTLIFDRDYTASYNSYQGYYQASLQYNILPSNNGGYYYICTSDIPLVSQAEPFVTWATSVPQQVQYQSYLPEPQWDLHNRYVVVNDTLYWISYYVNSAYIQQMSVESGSQVYQQSASGTEDGTYLDMSTSAYFYYHANDSITYNGIVYYPVSIQDMSLSFEDMICPCLVSGSTWRLSFDTDFFADYFNILNGFLLDYRIYVSSFDLITGEYIESIYSENTQLNNQDININIGLPEEVSSIYCYGVNFINRSNLPVNLASIVWSYDFDFATWRDDMYSKLDAIYNLLSQSDVPSTTAPVDYASLLDPEPTVSGYDAEDAGSLLAGAVSDVNVELGDGMDWGRNQINDFATGVPELFIVLILALAFGLTIMILGKKKSDN